MKNKHFSIEQIVAALKQAELGPPGPNATNDAHVHHRSNLITLTNSL